ncbi:MAG TPA: hypothetical protein VG845_09740 [Dehalococcoidia bacterium]|nr:hypothetical protein [Dehalococcoidia bacterium]
MDLPGKDEILSLSSRSNGPRVSLYLPTHRGGPEVRQDPIRLKNLVVAAEDQLAAQGLRPTLARDRLEPLRELVDDADFWAERSDGLCIFIDEEGRISKYRLPLAVEELMYVGPQFHLKPLLPLLFEGNTFYLLAISMNDIRLLHCTAIAEDEVKLPQMPRNMADVLWPDDPEKQTQFRGFYTGASGGTAEFHGAGGSEEDVKDDLLRYFQRVDAVLTPYLKKRERPLVLACVEYLAPIYRRANEYDLLVEDFVRGNPDELSPDELRKEGWQVMEPYFARVLDQTIDRYRSLGGTGLASADPAEAALAALDGRVDRAVVTLGVQRWGSIDIEGHTAETHDSPQTGDEDLLDFVAVQTLTNGGEVYTVDEDKAPEQTGIAAILRY